MQIKIPDQYSEWFGEQVVLVEGRDKSRHNRHFWDIDSLISFGSEDYARI